MYWFLTNKHVHLWISLVCLSQPFSPANSSPYPRTLTLPPVRVPANLCVIFCCAQGTLFTLSLITLTQSFLSTSPFAHLTPAIATLPTAPLAFIRDWVSVIRMHTQYTTEQTAESRRRNIQDAQKRRLYRRAHGLEDVEKEGVGQGIDVKGLVGWDDGLTRGERERMVKAAAEAVDEASPVRREEEEQQQQQRSEEPPRRERRPVKKWLGIW